MDYDEDGRHLAGMSDARERREKELAEVWFENEYPGLLKAIKRAVSAHAGDELYMRENVYEDLLFRIGEDLSQFTFKEALELAGRKPFDPWAVPVSNQLQSTERK